jgi:signal transduction histidine kinase
MRERAEVIGGRLTVWSEGGVGTEIELTIPAAAAYVRSRPRSSFFAGRTGAYL